MEEGNILSKGVYILYEIKEDLERNDELKEKEAKLAEEEKRFSKQLETAKKAEASEINTTISKRRSEIEASFDSQLNKVRTSMKKEQSRRASAKNTGVTKRIEDETQDLREEIRVNKANIKSLFSKNDIPSIFESKFFLSLFIPNGLGEYGIILLTVLVLLSLPLLVFWLAFPKEASGWWLLPLYLIVVCLVALAYYFLRKNVLKKYRKDFKDIQVYKRKIASLKRRISKKEQNIRQDSDESGYELEKFDTKINELQKQIDTIVEEKQDAITQFENKTKKDIATEIHTRYFEEIEEDQKALEKTFEEKHVVEAELSDITVKISKNYEAYLGKEVLSVSVIESLIDIINDGGAETVGDALEQYKKTVDKSIQPI